MKTITVVLALTALFCSLGLAGAQIIGLGEGYSSTQLAFFHSPSSSTFEPDVQSYWGNYITNGNNVTVNRATASMNIWMNTFPLQFDGPLQFSTTSFAGNAQPSTLTATQKNSQDLTRNVNNQFGIYQIWSYPQTTGSLTISNSTGVPAEGSAGKLLTQNIQTIFST
ncbi:MAG TPA: hypothetical protein PKL29_09600 [Methanothrix sp.]|nr:hypothetical protein [Methanothrix sp.]